GAATARMLGEQGARVFLVARRADRLKNLSEEIGNGAAYLALDLGAENVAEQMLDAAMAELGNVDILVNNAGILRTSHFEKFDLAELQPMIALNYTALVSSSIIFARHMKEQGSGQIINLSSIGASVQAAQNGIYGGLKKAVEVFTECLRIELAGSGVRVGIVAPGTTSTEIFDDMKLKGETGWDEYIPAMVPEDIARAIVFMCQQTGHANAARLHIYADNEGF